MSVTELLKDQEFLSAITEHASVTSFAIWFLIGAALVFFMQAGFAMVEAGFTRAKNAGNIIMKNLMDFCIGTVVFILLGFSIMMSENYIAGFIGVPNLQIFTDFGSFIETNASSFVFNLVFCATAATIVSGAMAERTKFISYCIYSAVISLFIYPVEAGWVWNSQGWLVQMGFHDFAGSAAIHTVGGTCALIGAAMLGPRLGKYTKTKDGKVKVNAIPGHNITIGALGCFILWFGWFGFNPGSQLAAATSGDQTAISHVFLTTNLAACAGGFFALVASWMKYGKPSLSLTLNGVLAGLVGITAGCDLVSPFGSVLIGAICGVVMIFAVDFIDHVLKIDDPVGASSVHGVCGCLGTILTGLFATEEGLFYGGGSSFLLAQLFGAAVVGVWAAGMGFIVFKVLDKIHGLRVPKRIEEEGLDIYEHGESAYN